MKHAGKAGVLFFAGVGLGAVVGVLYASRLTTTARRLRYYTSEALRSASAALDALRERVCVESEDANSDSVATFI